MLWIIGLDVLCDNISEAPPDFHVTGQLDLPLTPLLRTTQNHFTVYNFIKKLRTLRLPMGNQSLGILFLIYYAADVDRIG